MEDRIEKSIELRAPVERVWRALTDHREFSTWFCANLEGPFVAGRMTAGQITVPGFEHVRFEAHVERIEPPRYMSYRWHPFAIERDVDYSSEPMTLVEFTLEPTSTGTRLLVVESGFSKLRPERRLDAFGANTEGWEAQLENIEGYLANAA